MLLNDAIIHAKCVINNYVINLVPNLILKQRIQRGLKNIL